VDGDRRFGICLGADEKPALGSTWWTPHDENDLSADLATVRIVLAGWLDEEVPIRAEFAGDVR
jgi:hypothetical protein